MGYQSDGAIRIVGPKDRMLAEIAGLALLADNHLRSVLKEFILMPGGPDGAVLGLDFRGWKWYESYPDIQALEKIWSHFSQLSEDEDNSGFCGSFLRIGEDDDDTEQRTFGNEAWALIEFVRTFECEHILDPKNDLRNNRLSSNEQETT